ncbi:MAG: thioredoxin family protein [Candidatus Obscuribacterales bacterium]|nr:thioredoxin family protein [Candidatus Obscuribacterales bacterium]
MARKINNLILCATLIAVGAPALAQGNADAQTRSSFSTDESTTVSKPAWLTLSQGLAEAKICDKPIVVDVYTSWCGYCKKMDREVFSSPMVAPYLAENFVCVRINAEDGGEGQAFAQKQGIHAFPTSVFLNSKGENLSQLVGYKPAEAFLKKLQQVQTLKAHK